MSDIVPSSAPSIATGLSRSLAPSASVSQATVNLVPIAQALIQPLTERERITRLIIEALHINIALTDRSKATVASLTLPSCFERYKAISSALNAYQNMVDDKSWAATGIRSLRDLDIIEVFIGKSLYYEHWEKIFDPVTRSFPIMSDWLEGSTDKTPLQVWGVAKSTPYDRADLKIWLERGGTLKEKKEKKEKAGKILKKTQKDKDKDSGLRKDKHSKNSKGSKR